MSVAKGFAYLANDGVTVTGLPRIISDVGNYNLLYYIPNEGFTMIRPEGFGSMGNLVQIMPLPVVMVIFVLILLHFILHKTLFGRYIFAIGNNSKASMFAGISIDKTLIKTYMLASLLYGIAGILYTLRFSNAAPNMGEPMLLNAIGAVFIGGTSMTGGEGRLSGTVVGALIIAILQAGLTTIGVTAFWQYVAVGVVIIVAVLFDGLKKKFMQ